MNKFFRKALILVAILGMGTSVTSCDSDSIGSFIQQMLPTIIQVLNPSTSGTSQQFVGEIQAQCLVRTDTTQNQWSYYNGSDAKVAVESVTCNLIKQQVTDSNNTTSTEIYVTIPSLTLGGQTYTNLEFDGGTFTTTDGSTGTFNTGDQFYYIAFDNMVGTLNYACISNGKVTDSQVSFDYQVVAGFNAFNGSYVGTLNTTTTE